MNGTFRYQAAVRHSNRPDGRGTSRTHKTQAENTP